MEEKVSSSEMSDNFLLPRNRIDSKAHMKQK